MSESANGRILRDPTQDVPPDYNDPRYERFVDNLTPEDGSREDTINNLVAVWKETHALLVAAWNTQLESDEATARIAGDEARALAQAEEEARAAAAEADRLAAEKRKPKMPAIDPIGVVQTYSPARVATYAREKLRKLEYVEMHWFTPEKCREVSHSARDTDKNYHIVESDDGQLTLSTNRGSGKTGIIADKHLSFKQLQSAKHAFLRTAREVGWDVDHILAYSDLFLALEAHELSSQEHGEEVLVRYFDEVRHEWHDLIADGTKEIFNIGIISESRMKRIDDSVIRKVQLRRCNTVRPPSFIVSQDCS
ncbi:hypothetical protein AURDEDRAFT_70277 [Auricularia subglabra TFB-10046 SS5]|nr:hypothetical protein AURDEDRAFT_70277 [Auricularia subglabra TFB-10046 SS5]